MSMSVICAPPQYFGLPLPGLDHWEVLPVVYGTAILLQLESLAFTLWNQRASNCSPRKPSVHTVNPGASMGQGSVKNK